MTEIIIPAWLVGFLGCVVLIVAALAALAFLLVVGIKLVESIIRKVGLYRAVVSYVIAHAQGVRFDGETFRFPSGKRCVFVNGWPCAKSDDEEETQ